MGVISEATRELIEGGSICLRPRKKRVEARVELLGLGVVLRVADAARRRRIGGSGACFPLRVCEIVLPRKETPARGRGSFKLGSGGRLCPIRGRDICVSAVPRSIY